VLLGDELVALRAFWAVSLWTLLEAIREAKLKVGLNHDLVSLS